MFRNLGNPVVERKEIKGKDCIRFIFKETLSYTEAESFIAEWKEVFSAKKGEKVILVWECLEMTNDKTEARAVFQNALKDLKDKIEMIWLVTDSILIQAEAEIISFFASYQINIVRSEKELFYKIANQKTSLD